jgi:hypothetical protein
MYLCIVSLPEARVVALDFWDNLLHSLRVKETLIMNHLVISLTITSNFQMKNFMIAHENHILEKADYSASHRKVEY